uniref:Uncharacterized protein n=1 Tax=Octopus bimaculoides TaxID=37653 RepID=A0A0L8GM75_OCTBM
MVVNNIQILQSGKDLSSLLKANFALQTSVLNLATTAKLGQDHTLKMLTFYFMQNKNAHFIQLFIISAYNFTGNNFFFLNSFLVHVWIFIFV